MIILKSVWRRCTQRLYMGKFHEIQQKNRALPYFSYFCSFHSWKRIFKLLNLKSLNENCTNYQLISTGSMSEESRKTSMSRDLAV